MSCPDNDQGGGGGGGGKDTGTKLKYDLLSTVRPELMTTIQTVFILSHGSKPNVIFITNNEDVYGFGDNCYGKVGFGHSNPVAQPTLITQLCGKRIIDIVEGMTFMAALTQGSENGQIYTWGTGAGGQLGNGKDENTIYPPIAVNLNEKQFIGEISDVKITYFGSVVLLTKTGSVYRFGFRHYNKSKQLTPIRMTGAQDQEFVEICAGYDHIIARTVTGRVYSCGNNNYGQLGLGHNRHCNDLTPIEMSENTFITSVATYDCHTLLLTREGDVYAFGFNECSQLGTGDTVNQNKPKFIVKYNKFKNIFAFNHKSFAISNEGFVYIWGLTPDGKVLRPKRTDFKSFQEAIDNTFKRLFTYKPLKYNDLFEPKNRIYTKISSAFNNKDFSDLKIKVEEKVIYVNKWFVALNCRHFGTMFSHQMSESKTNVVEIKDHSYEAYYAFLRCLYTDSIDVEDVNVLIDFMDITNEYFEEDLKLKCVHKIKPFINTKNVCALYSASIKYSSSELMVYCFEYMNTIEHMDEIIASEGYQQMDSIYAKHFLTQQIKYTKEVINQL